MSPNIDQDIFDDLESLFQEMSGEFSEDFSYRLENELDGTYLIVTPFFENEDGILEEVETDQVRFRLVEV